MNRYKVFLVENKVTENLFLISDIHPIAQLDEEYRVTFNNLSYIKLILSL